MRELDSRGSAEDAASCAGYIAKYATKSTEAVGGLMYRLDADGKHATRMGVRLGRISANSVEIVQGLKPGDKVILSDLSLPDNPERIRIK